MSIKDDKEEVARESSDYENVDIEKGSSPPDEEIRPAKKESEKTEDDLGDELERHLSRKSTRRVKLGPETYLLTDLDKGLIGWDHQDDPANPRNFADRRKWFILGLVSAITFLSPLASSIFAPGISFVSRDFHNSSQILGAFSVSVFVLGFSFGPLFLSPLSEIYGRLIILNIANVFFCAFNLGCALAPNLTGLIIMRLLAGTGGSACLTIGSGVISDLFLPEQRGKAMAMYSLGILFGPVLGPICGGFIAQRAGWKWDFWVVFIAGVTITSGIILMGRETNAIVLIDRKTARLRKELNRPELRNILTHKQDANSLRTSVILRRGMYRPLKLLFTSPIVFILSLYVSFVFGLLFLLFTTITQVYIQTYGWSPELCGLAYLGVGLGFFLGIIFVAKTSDATIIRLTKKNNGVYEPEMRLPTCVFFGFLIPISFFWYGWATDKQAHWIVPIIGLLPFGFGMMGIFAPIQTYLIDSFPQYAASAVAGMTAIRCLFGAVLPLGAPSMYDKLGLGWGNSLLGFIAVAMIPAPALIYKYGGYVRKRWPVEL
ncbi:MFS general substrate transporter [Lindgomyces ingoldianus]|uniref:MFS general substrate transporter n=1 Tax=Lindgomyces ingoldianus TaxID=673940 RepID=A0ACB6QZT7_9PLEO|nr:MFS general substrate transporter [Lindgomyces ingoldianus]KAF2472292.1 MFS general substrate transporter [Lindgomyces ingoldianus]